MTNTRTISQLFGKSALILTGLFVVTIMNSSVAQISDFQFGEVDFTSSYVERPKLKNGSHFIDAQMDFNAYLQTVEHSGKLISNGREVDFLNEITQEIDKASKKRTVIVKSNVVGTFSSDSTIYITTGLIAQTQNTDQLAFFISREIAANTPSEFWNDQKKNKYIGSSYDDKILALTQRTLSEEIELDKAALDYFEKMNMKKSTLISCLNILKYGHLPYAIRKVPANYFNSDNYYVPERYFEQVHSNNSTIVKSNYNEKLLQRLKSVGFQPGDSAEEHNDQTEDYLALQKASRFSYLDEAIIRGEFEVALYTIFLLESDYNEVEILKHKKVQSWYGFAMREMQITKSMESAYYKNLFSSKILFLQVLRKLPSGAKLTMALQVLHENKDISPETNQLWKNLLFHIKNYSFFDLKEYSSQSYYSVFRNKENLSNNSTGSKYDELEKRNNLSNSDSTKFYLYCMANIIRDSSFWTELNEVQAKHLPSESTFTILPSVSYLKKKRVDHEKSEEKLNQLVKALEEDTAFNVHSSINELENAIRVSVKHCFSEEYGISKYDQSIPFELDFPVNDALSVNSDYIVFPFFQSTVKPRLKPKYFVGLFIAPIPYVVTDFLLTFHQSSYAALIVDAKTSIVVHVEYVNYNEPLTSVNMRERILNSINQTIRVQ